MKTEKIDTTYERFRHQLMVRQKVLTNMLTHLNLDIPLMGTSHTKYWDKLLAKEQDPMKNPMAKYITGEKPVP